jgi:hypothetical protein
MEITRGDLEQTLCVHLHVFITNKYYFCFGFLGFSGLCPSSSILKDTTF